MRSTRARWLLLACLCTLAGCYEDEATITLNPDGSGTIEQNLSLSEQMVVALSTGLDPEQTPPATKERLLQSIGSAFEVTSLTLKDRPDGGRLIRLSGRFKSADQLFLSKYCKNKLKVSLAPMEGGKAAVHYTWRANDSATSVSIEQMYGLAKGLHITRSVRLPAAVEKTNGRHDAGEKKVSWEIDLRDKEALARTKAFMEGPDKGEGVAVFRASALSFALPLRVPMTPEQTALRDPNGPRLTAEVLRVSVQKTREIKKGGPIQRSFTEVSVQLSREDATQPIHYEGPVLVSLSDDLGHNLVPRNASSSSSVIPGGQKTGFLTWTGDAPGAGAKKLKNLSGYVEVADKVVTEDVTLKNIASLAGKETVGNAVLDKLHFKIRSVKDNSLSLTIDGGASIIQSIALLKEDGAEIKTNGSSSWSDQCIGDFRESIPASATCKLTIVVSQTKVKVPFALEEVDLP